MRIKKHGRYGDGVANERKNDGQGQVYPEQDGKDGGAGHLDWQRNKCAKCPNGRATGGRTSVNMPQVGIVQMVSQEIQAAMGL